METAGANRAFPHSEVLNVHCTKQKTYMAFGEILLKVQEGLLSTKKQPFWRRKNPKPYAITSWGCCSLWEMALIAVGPYQLREVCDSASTWEEFAYMQRSSSLSITPCDSLIQQHRCCVVAQLLTRALLTQSHIQLFSVVAFCPGSLKTWKVTFSLYNSLCKLNSPWVSVELYWLSSVGVWFLSRFVSEGDKDR